MSDVALDSADAKVLDEVSVSAWTAYPEYKDSDVEWLGEIPNHWEVKRLKFLLTEPLKYGANESAEYEVPEWPRFIRITDLDEEGGLRGDTFKSLPEEVAAPYLLEDGDLLMARSGATVGKTFLYSASWGRAAYAGYLIRARFNKASIHPRFATFFCRSANYWDWLNSIFIQATIQNVSAEKYANLFLPIPPKPEQDAILSFLDRETTRIDALIAKKQRLIELLQEKRTALISQAVTKGLDPGVPMKDSGVEWLGEIPAHWEVKRLNFLTRGGLVNGLFKKKDQFGTGTLLVNVFDIYQEDFLINPETLDRVEVDNQEARRYGVEEGDIFFVRSSIKPAGVGRSACATEIDEPMVFECHLVRSRPDQSQIVPKFLVNFLNSYRVTNRLVALANLVTMATLDQGKIKGLQVPLPSIDEQVKIAESIDSKTIQVAKIITKINNAIGGLTEYRTALISAAVTGKIDVREMGV